MFKNFKSAGATFMLVVLVGLMLRCLAIYFYPHQPESDEVAYRDIALNILEGNGALQSGNRAFYNVGYPAFVLVPAFYLFENDLMAARVANTLLGIISIILCYAVAKECGAGRLGRLLAALAWAVYLPTGIYGVYLAKENLMVPLMLGIAWCALRMARAYRPGIGVLCGVLVALLALTGNAGLSLAAMIGLAILWTPTTLVRRVALAATVLLTTLIVASPWLIRNSQILGATVFNTNGGFNIYLGNNPNATGFFVSIADTPRGESWESLRQVGEIYASETLKAEAIAWIRENPARFSELAVLKLRYFWTPPFHSGRDGDGSTAETVVRIAWSAQFVLLVSTALLLPVFKRGRTKAAGLMWVAVLGYTAVHMLFYVIYRYRLPIMPFVAILAAMSLELALVRFTTSLSARN